MKLFQEDRFNYLGSCITADDRISDKMSASMQKARLANTNLRHLWSR